MSTLTMADTSATPIAPGGPIVVSEHTDPATWDRFVSSHPEGTCDHLWAWREIFSGVFGHEPVYLSASVGGEVVGVLPLVRFRSQLFGRFVVSLPFLNYGGVLVADPRVTPLLIERATALAQAFGAAHVELRHRSQQCPSLPDRQHKLALTRPLPESTEQLWATIDRKVRNQVRKAQKDGLTSAVGGNELVPEFYDVFARNMRDLGTPVYPMRLFSETLRVFPDSARVHLVRLGTTTMAASISLRHADTVLVPWASSLREYRQHCPNMLLYWGMLEHAVTSGARVFDFGRSSPDSGTHHFKVQWGGQEAPMHWEYVLLTAKEAPDQGPKNPKFSAAIAAWQKLPLWMTTAIGPAIVRNIP